MSKFLYLTAARRTIGWKFKIIPRTFKRRKTCILPAVYLFISFCLPLLFFLLSPKEKLAGSVPRVWYSHHSFGHKQILNSATGKPLWSMALVRADFIISPPNTFFFLPGRYDAPPTGKKKTTWAKKRTSFNRFLLWEKYLFATINKGIESRTQAKYFQSP